MKNILLKTRTDIISVFKVIMLCLGSILSVIHLNAQPKDNWDTYIAQYEKGPGSIVVNMGLKNKAPIAAYRFCIITGVTFTDCNKDGFPNDKQFTDLYKISDSVHALIASRVKSIGIGSFTYQCQRLDYIFVSDTANLRTALHQLYKNRFPKYAPYLNIVEDKKWDRYLSFLYPNEETQEYMRNEKVLINLQKAGDALTKPRKVEHWIYFKTEADRGRMMAACKTQKFIIESVTRVQDKEEPYSLHISRNDKVDIVSISAITLQLRRQAQQFNGIYDGWETVIVK